MPHLQVTASEGSEFLVGDPTSDGIAVPTRKDVSNLDAQSLKKDAPSAAAVDSNKQSQPEAKSKTKERSPFSGTLRVYDSSFVRDKPRSDANITGTLEPGTRIKIQSKTGDYFRVRSLDRDPISGYVHREDAFFEPVK
jgi:Bacterial SH3 domain